MAKQVTEVVGNTRSEFADGGARTRTDDDSGVDFGRARSRLGAGVLGVLEDGVRGLCHGFGRRVYFRA